MNLVLDWNPFVMAKYRMVDYNITEIAALEAVFPDTKVYLYDFHREQSWSR